VCAVIAAHSVGVEFGRWSSVRKLRELAGHANEHLRAARQAESEADSNVACADRRVGMRDQLAARYRAEFVATRRAAMVTRLAQIKAQTPVTEMLDWAEKVEVFRSLGLGWELSGLPPAKNGRWNEFEQEAAA
jgi:hypothetical protein